MRIPQYVKIQGKHVRVIESTRGYVTVGETTREMDSETKHQLTDYERRTGDSGPWRKEMYRLFERAKLAESKRLRS